MTTVRRLYFYVLVLISIEVVIWGVVGLLRTIFSSGLVGGSSLLATGLSLVLVGLPIFWLHWRTVQRDAADDPAERSSRIRAVFFYALITGLVGPIAYAVLALLNRGLLRLLENSEYTAWFGANQSLMDNLLAILVNAVVLFYFWRVLQSDWRAGLVESFLPETRRLYRYLWVIIGLVITIGGVWNLVRYVLMTSGQNPGQNVPVLAGGLAFLLVGVPLWGGHWWVVQESLVDPAERRSLLRLVVLYLISLAGVIGVLTTAGVVINSLIRWLTGETQTFVEFIQANSSELGWLVPLAVMWAYYGRVLTRSLAALPDQPQRFALRRLYFYILSLLGLAVTFVGLLNLIDFTVGLIFTTREVVGSYRSMLSGAVSALCVGLPLWLVTWKDMQFEAARKDDPGDHARRSIVRKAYLYLVLFLLVVGAMGFSGQFLFTLLNAVLSQQVPADLGQTLVKLLFWLALDVVLLVYHFRSLRRDNRLSQATLGELHAAFPTLVLSESQTLLNNLLIQEINRTAPRLPVALHPIEQGAPDEAMLAAKAILLPVGLAIDPPESLRLWLSEYRGRRLLLPLSQESYTWLGQVEKKPQDLAREAARAVRQMAEGEALRQSLPGSPWAIAGYILGGLFGLQLLIVLFSMMISVLFQF